VASAGASNFLLEEFIIIPIVDFVQSLSHRQGLVNRIGDFLVIIENFEEISQEFFSGKTNGPEDFGIGCPGFQLKHFQRIFFKAGSNSIKVYFAGTGNQVVGEASGVVKMDADKFL